MKPAKGNHQGGGPKKVQEYTFCRVCRINHNHGPKHKFHAKHKYALDSTLEKEATKISEFKSFASQRLTGGLFSAQRWCIFCDKDTSSNKDTAFLSMLQHLSSKEHKKNVIDFLKEMGSNENRNKFYVQKGILKQFVNGDRDHIPTSNVSSPSDIHSNGTSTPVSPTTATTPTDGLLTDKKDDTEPKAPKTVISVNGIRQNPTGWDNGERVWGGGIVKYKREGEWQPWPIDLDNESDTFDTLTLMGGAIIPGLLSSVSAQNNIVASAVAPTATSVSANGIFTHPSFAKTTAQESKQTEFAFSAGLSRVDPLPQLAGAGNIHSGATPPWMVDDSGSTIPTITPFTSLSERERRGKKQQQTKNDKRKKQKVGANVDREKAEKQSANPNWLPNFGSVWQAGPRSETRKNFGMQKPTGIRLTQPPLTPVDVGTKLALKRKQQEM